MKNFAIIGGITKKKLRNRLCNTNKFSFCAKTDLIEHEILKSFSNFSRKFNIENQSKKEPVYPPISPSLSLDFMKRKYFDKSSEKEVDKLISAIFREEVLNMQKEKDYESLLLFIKNCKKYNYEFYLEDVSYFKNKEIRQFITNTSLLESLHQERNPFSLSSEFEMKMKVQSLYKLRKGQKEEKIDSITEKEFEVDYYNYLNFLAETSAVEKAHQRKKIKSHNEKVLSEFSQGDNMVDSDQDVGIRDEVWKNHYINYLHKMKKAERKESFGLSRYEEPYFIDSIEKNQEEIFASTSGDYTKTDNTEEYKAFRATKKREEEGRLNSKKDNSESKSASTARVNRFDGIHITTNADYINDGTNEPFPFYDLEDYPIEEFMDESKNLPGKDLVFAPLRPEGEPNPLPPKWADWGDRFWIDTHYWSLFTHVLQQKIWNDSTIKTILEGVSSIITMNKNLKLDLMDVDLPPSLIDYYHLLPKWAREHPTVKMVVRGLEFHQPYSTYKEKMMAVNYTLQVLMTKDRHYNELINMMDGNRPEDITLDSLPSLMEHNEEEQRNVLTDNNDEATDDEELDMVGTADDVRAMEREEEEARKLKKKEEGRAKREAEEQKQAAAEGKVDKAAEDKKKKEKEEAEKKKKEAEGEEAAEEEAEEETEETKATGGENDKEKAVEERMFSPTSKRKSKNDREEETLGIYDGIIDKLQGATKEDVDLSKMDEDYIDEQPQTKTDEAVGDFENELEDLRRKSKEQKIAQENRKSKLMSILRDLKNSANISTFEEKIKFLKRNLEEVSEKPEILIKKLETAGGNKVEEIIMYPLSLLKSSELTDEMKFLVRKHFKDYITGLKDEIKVSHTIQLDSKSEKTLKNLEDDLISKISTFESEMKETSEGFDIQTDYREGLRDEEVSIEVSEEVGLQDAFYKADQEMDYKERFEDPIPFDYFINDDGFWDNYIASTRNRIHVSQFSFKPFNPYKNNIKKQLL